MGKDYAGAGKDYAGAGKLIDSCDSNVGDAD